MPDTFIESYLQHTSIYESPSSFWKWSAYSTISAILKDKCYLKQGDSFLFANIYVLFLAKSSVHRKGRPVELGEWLVSQINNTKIISGRSSVQAIMDELARTETGPDGKVIKCSSGIFYAPELEAGIVADPAALGVLTDIYDYKLNDYKQRLRTGPSFNLSRLVFSMLMASNEEMIKDFWNVKAIKGGMLARTALIVPNEFRKGNTLMRVDHVALKASRDNVLSRLREINTLSGEFTFTEEALVEYENWYHPFRKSYEQKDESSGVFGRVHTSVLKLAMILAANEREMIIKKIHIEQSIEEWLNLMQNYSIFTMQCGKTEIGQAGGVMITELLNAPEFRLSRKELLRRCWQYFDSDMLDKLMATFEAAGMLQTLQLKEGFFMQLTAQCINSVKGGK